MTFALLGPLGPLEIGVILIVVLLVFGPSKLPQLGEGVGKMLRGFKKEMKSMEEDSNSDKVADKDEPAEAAPRAVFTACFCSSCVFLDDK